MCESDFYGPEDNIDKMFEKVNKLCTIFARPNVIRQWYYILREINSYYPAGEDGINRIVNLVEKC